MSDKTKRTAGKPANYHPPDEFGGIPGAILGMIFLPITVYYLWICLEFYDGAIQYPQGVSDIGPFFSRMLHHVFVDAAPTWRGAAIYLGWFFLQAILAWLGPGPVGEGAVLKDGKTRLKYTFNGIFAWAVTLSLAGILHYTDLFKVSALYDNFGSIFTVANLWASFLALYCYFYAFYYRVEERISGNILYDYFMGTVLNPRIGSFDIKFFCEIRPGIMLWFFLTLSIAVKQYEVYGFTTTPVLLLVFYHFCYANACYKGEECIPMSMDIIYEKFGWMLCWADLVWVPFTYCFPAYYLIKVAPFEPPLSWSAFVLVLHLAGYYIFDTSNSQKDAFRGARHQDMKWYRTFPWLPWGRVKDAKYLQTKRGTKLLLSGWWGIARHMNYTGDLMMAWAWGLTAGFGSFIPYFYAIYMTLLLLHREGRDNIECKRKYGADWDKYCKLVPYRLIPYVY